ncbi:hypothetical protein [Rhizobium sp. AG855]|uniref:hypothetical protein n=1 Tax=Rhizobium sp. AG855 TaxID=2183898 RepID=UPI000E7202C2|nr:hypothetical protein [Rhizobium sp. AG855]RKE84607.1 hypothetical protein DFO46_1377 [Rhizobium sp. AG855]
MDGLGLIMKQLEMMSDRLDTIASEGSRRGRDLHDKLNQQGRDLAVLTHRLGSLEDSVNGQAVTLNEYQDFKKKAEGAGWLGQKLLRFGWVILAVAGWVYGSWTNIVSMLKWLVGRV